MKKPRGFTLMELMIVTVILGILLSIGFAKYASILRKSDDGVTKGNLGAIRSALAIYYTEMESYPTVLESLTLNKRYLREMPQSRLYPLHGESRAVSAGAGTTALTDVGGWAYVNAYNDTTFGQTWVNCTHTDAKNDEWSYF